MYYLVVESNGHVQTSYAMGGARDILVVFPDTGELPAYMNMKQLLVLHAAHANRSEAMKWHSTPGVFRCPHCDGTVRFDGSVFQKILTLLSQNNLSSFIDLSTTEGKVQIAWLVDEFPPVERKGIFAVKMLI